MPKLKRPFWDVDLRLGHDGLREYASRRGEKLNDLRPGEFLLFVNSKLSAYKALLNTGEKDGLGLLSSYKSPHGRMELGAIQYLAKAVDPLSGGFNYEAALRESLEERIKPKRRKLD